MVINIWRNRHLLSSYRCLVVLPQPCSLPPDKYLRTLASTPARSPSGKGEATRRQAGRFARNPERTQAHGDGSFSYSFSIIALLIPVNHSGCLVDIPFFLSSFIFSFLSFRSYFCISLPLFILHTPKMISKASSSHPHPMLPYTGDDVKPNEPSPWSVAEHSSGR